MNLLIFINKLQIQVICNLLLLNFTVQQANCAVKTLC